MTLIDTASRVYQERGDEGLEEWATALTVEQRLALVHEFDQFGAAMREVGDAIGPVIESLQAMSRDLAGKDTP